MLVFPIFHEGYLYCLIYHLGGLLEKRSCRLLGKFASTYNDLLPPSYSPLSLPRTIEEADYPTPLNVPLVPQLSHQTISSLKME